MLLLEQKIRIMEHENLGERVFAAERINKKRQLCQCVNIFEIRIGTVLFLNEEPVSDLLVLLKLTSLYVDWRTKNSEF
jgi:hypothetical protein